MNIVFLGSASFAQPGLKILMSTHHRISAVVTQPDSQKGRGLTIARTPVKTTALEQGLQIYQPGNINCAEGLKFLKSLQPDLLIVIAYGQILSEKLLEIPKIFAINLHASLLPKYRGAAPINWALINGETTTGVTVMKMVGAMDAGPIIAQKKIALDCGDTATAVEEKLSDTGAHLLLQSLKAIESGEYQLTPQDREKVTFAPKLKKEDGLILWEKSAAAIYNLIRGCAGWPGTLTYYHGKILKVYHAKAVKIPATPLHYLPGQICKISKEGIYVVAGKDGLLIKELQVEGKRKMSAEEFISGHRVSAGETLGREI